MDVKGMNQRKRLIFLLLNLFAFWSLAVSHNFLFHSDLELYDPHTQTPGKASYDVEKPVNQNIIFHD